MSRYHAQRNYPAVAIGLLEKTKRRFIARLRFPIFWPAGTAGPPEL